MLPSELWCYIISFLDCYDTETVKLVCREAYDGYRIVFDHKLKKEIRDVMAILNSCKIRKCLKSIHKSFMLTGNMERNDIEIYTEDMLECRDIIYQHPSNVKHATKYIFSQYVMEDVMKTVHKHIIKTKLRNRWIILAPTICNYRYNICWANTYQPWRCCSQRKYEEDCLFCHKAYPICKLCKGGAGFIKKSMMEGIITYDNKFFICSSCYMFDYRAIIETCPCTHKVFPMDRTRYCRCQI